MTAGRFALTRFFSSRLSHLSSYCSCATVSIARAVRPRLADVVGTLGSSFSFAAPVIGLLHARSLNEWCVRMRQESATYLADWTCDHMSSQHMSSHRMR